LRLICPGGTGERPIVDGRPLRGAFFHRGHKRPAAMAIALLSLWTVWLLPFARQDIDSAKFIY
jgi:hypothetical protein